MKQSRMSSKLMGTRKVVHGGESRPRGRKGPRPVALKTDMHLVLKSNRAYGAWSLYKHDGFVQKTLFAKAAKFGVQIKSVVNMGNHLHIQLRAHHRKNFGKFLKSTTALIARHITGASKSNKVGRFWQGLPFTRILTSKFEALGLKHYLVANRLESTAGHTARREYLERINRWMKMLKVKR